MSGYIGNIPTPQATQTRDVFTATASQTTFNTAGYTPGFVDVWLNGVKLVNGDDFTATNGSDVVLTVGAASGDTVEVLSFSTFEVNSQTFTGDFTVDGSTFVVDSTNNRVGVGTSSPSAKLDVVSTGTTSETIAEFGNANINNGLTIQTNGNLEWGFNATNSRSMTFSTNQTERMRIDASGNLLVGKTSDSFGTVGSSYRANGSISATASANEVLDLNRLSTDGNIMRFFKDGTTVGSIGAASGTPYFADSVGRGHRVYVDGVTRFAPTLGGSAYDAAIDLGQGTNRWRDLYLSGGVYLGGTGAANKLDDYEEGTWSPYWSNASGNAIFNAAPAASSARYTKVGDTVHAQCYFAMPSSFGVTGFYAAGGALCLGGLPFTSNRSGSLDYSGVTVGWYNQMSGLSVGYSPMMYVESAGTIMPILYANGQNVGNFAQSTAYTSGSGLIISVSYKTAS